MEHDTIVKLRFVGNISPDRVPISDLVDFLRSFEESLKELLAPNGSSPTGPEPVFGLVRIEDSSAGYVITGPEQARAVIYEHLGPALERRDLTSFSAKAIKGIQAIHAITKKYQVTFELTSVNDPSKTLAVIAPDTEFTYPKTTCITGHTTIYGELIRIGNVDKPVATIRPKETSNLLSCNVASKSLAEKMATFLYHRVGASGNAAWNSSTWEIESFEITDIVPYHEAPITESFRAVSKASKGAWLDVPDVEAAVRKIRGGGTV